MFSELTRELLELTARRRGEAIGAFAMVLDCCSCSCCGCVANC
jgi:hypothetical protein